MRHFLFKMVPVATLTLSVPTLARGVDASPEVTVLITFCRLSLA